MPIRFLSLFLISLAFSKTWASGGGSSLPGVAPEYVSGTCIVNSNDPYEPNVKIEKGPFKGLCVDPTVRRSPKILTDQEARNYFEPSPDHMIVANFSHKGQFWVAKIPVLKAEKMILQTQYFPLQPVKVIKIAHTQFRIELADGAFVELVPQVADGKNKSQSVKLKNLIFSVENVGADNTKFDPMKGMKDYYNIAYRVVSIEDKYKWMIADQGHKVTQYLMRVRPEQVSQFLIRALKEADQWSTRRSYHTFEPNCVSELFVLLDEVLGIKGKYYPLIPNYAARYFHFRGLIEVSDELPTLNEEYGNKN